MITTWNYMDNSKPATGLELWDEKITPEFFIKEVYEGIYHLYMLDISSVTERKKLYKQISDTLVIGGQKVSVEKITLTLPVLKKESGMFEGTVTAMLPNVEDFLNKKRMLTEAAFNSSKTKADQALKGWGDIQCQSEYNKTDVNKFYRENVPGYVLLHQYSTSCGNSTVVFARIPNNSKSFTVSIPDHLKGLVIGKGGANIKSVCEKTGLKIKIV